MKTEILLAALTLLLGFTIHIVVVSIIAGKLLNRVSSAEKDNDNLGTKINNVNKKVDRNREETFEMFVTREVNIIYNEMNSKEHATLAIAIENQTRILESIQDCIHKMQGGKECD